MVVNGGAALLLMSVMPLCLLHRGNASSSAVPGDLRTSGSGTFDTFESRSLQSRTPRDLPAAPELPAAPTLLRCVLSQDCPSATITPAISPTYGPLTAQGLLRVQRSCPDAPVNVSFCKGPVGWNVSQDGLSLTVSFSGAVIAPPLESYHLCWCEPGNNEDCASPSAFGRDLASITVFGVQAETFKTCVSGQPCMFREVQGVGVFPGDRLAPLHQCPPRNPTTSLPAIPGMPGTGILSTKGDRRGGPPTDVGNETTNTSTQGQGVFEFVPADLSDNTFDPIMHAHAGFYSLCFCRPSESDPCTGTSSFRASAGFLSVFGPNQGHSFHCELGQDCTVMLNGLVLSTEDRIMILPSCGKSSTQFSSLYNGTMGTEGLEVQLPAWSASDFAPGSYDVCWCSSRSINGYYPCTKPKHFTTSAGKLTLWCPAGQFSIPGAMCQDCPTNNYCPGNLTSSRISCPGGSQTAGPKATSASDCYCRRGFYAASGAGTDRLHCLQCSPGTFAVNSGQTACEPNGFTCVLGQLCTNMSLKLPQSAAGGSITLHRESCGTQSTSFTSALEGGRMEVTHVGHQGMHHLGFLLSHGQPGFVTATPQSRYPVCLNLDDGLGGTTHNLVGSLTVEGPLPGDWLCTLGDFCEFVNVPGVNLRPGDRLTVAYECDNGEQPNGLPGTGIAVWNNNTGENSIFTFEEEFWQNKLMTEPGLYEVCFCRPGPDHPCTDFSMFSGHAGYMTAVGPNLRQKSFVCEVGWPCVMDNLVGVDLSFDNKAMLLRSCNWESSQEEEIGSGVGLDAEQDGSWWEPWQEEAGNSRRLGVGVGAVLSPVPYSDNQLKPNNYTLGSVNTNIHPGDWRLCWCMGPLRCERPEDFTIEVATVTFICHGDSYIEDGQCKDCCTTCFMLRWEVKGAGASKTCSFDWLHLLGIIILVIDLVCLIVVLSFFAGLPVLLQDVYTYGSEVVVITATRHFVLKWGRVPVLFRQTGAKRLDSPSELFTARFKERRELHLLDSCGRELGRKLETSTGEVRVPRGYAALRCGLLGVPFIVWAPLMLCVAAAVIHWCSIDKLEVPAAIAFSLVVAVFWRWRIRCWGYQTPIRGSHEAFRKRLPAPVACPRGPSRALSVQKLLDFHDHYQAHIRGRDMYYIKPNILMPLTKAAQLSYAEVAGPETVDWFISHFWGMPFRNFTASVEKHARCVAPGENWTAVSYWICTFSNNQWIVGDELGHGSWEESSFNLALQSDSCQGTAMVLDDQALPLTRSWCLFEVLQTARRSERSQEKSDSFQGLYLCTSSGVLNKGTASVDVATALGKRLSSLRMQDASASRKEDKEMIDSLVESMPGGFDAMNAFVHSNIRACLKTMKSHSDEEFEKLLSALSVDDKEGKSWEAPKDATLKEQIWSYLSSTTTRCSTTEITAHI